jgi:hypothetical protein
MHKGPKSTLRSVLNAGILHSTMITLGPSLTGLRGTQVTGSIIYTLVTLCCLIAVEFIGSHIRSMN